MRALLDISRPDIFTPADRSYALRFVVGTMALMATLVLALGLWINQSVSDWRGEAAGEITVELPANIAEEELAALVEKVSASHLVVSARALPKAEVLDMLSPWLGSTSQSAGQNFALPRLVAVKLKPTAKTSTFADFLKPLAADGYIDDHGATLNELLALSLALQAVVLGLIILIAATTFAVVSFATRAAIQSHRDVIAIVHQIGATDRYISAEFERYFFRAGLAGAVAGWALGLALTACIVFLAPNNAGIAVELTPSTPALVALGLVPLVLALVATQTARLTVLRQLQAQL